MMHHELLQHLVNRIPPPERPDIALGTTLHSSHGPSVTLPADYRMFLDVYGPGWFVEGRHPSLWMLDLVSSNEKQDIGGQDVVEMALQCAEELHEEYPDTYPPAYPTMPGLLPWGTLDGGHTFYWWIDGEPNSWRITVNAQAEIVHYDYSMLEFLAVNMDLIPGEKLFETNFSLTGFLPLSEEYQPKGRDVAS